MRRTVSKRILPRLASTRIAASTLLLFLFTSDGLRAGETRHATLMIDASSSMAGAKLDAAREGAKLFVQMLDEPVDVQIVAFHDAAQVSPRFTLGTPADRASALAWIDRLRAAGRTDYLKALRAVPLNEDLPVIFLSDGEPTVGRPVDVLQFLRKHCRARLHTIAVGCGAQSQAEKLLAEMAGLTNGSFTRVDRSEDVVTTLAQIAVRLGNYYRYSPQEHEVELGIAALGTLIAFGFDGIPEIEADPSPVIRRHYAKLPGEKVHALVASLTEPQRVRLKLRDKQRPTARLGDVHVAGGGFPIPKMTVGTSSGKVAAGSPLDVRIEFQDRTGQVLNLSVHNHIGAAVELRGPTGQVVQRVAAEPTPDNQALTATVQIPNHQGALTVRGLATVNSPQGQPFQAETEQTVMAVKPLQLQAAPARLIGKPKIGPFSVRVSLAGHGAAGLTAITAEIEGSAPGVRLVQTKRDGDAVVLDFEAVELGLQHGSVLLKADAQAPVTPVSVPFEFDVQPKSLGLALGNKPSISFGTIPAGTGEVTTTFPVSSLDDDEFEYSVSPTILSGPTTTIEAVAKPEVFTPTTSAPSKLKLTVVVANVPAGDYAGSLSIREKESALHRQWQIPVRLAISEPLTASPISFGDVEVGSVAAQTMTIANRASVPVEGIVVSPPVEWHDADNVVTDDLVATLEGDLKSLCEKEECRVKLRVVVSPTLKARGRLRGDVVVKRGTVEAVRVPVSLNVVDAGQGPARLDVGPEKIKLASGLAEVVEFSLVCRLLETAEQDDELECEISDFEGPDGGMINLNAAFDWPNTARIERRKSTSVKAFLIAPKVVGTYRATIQVRSRAAGARSIPLSLTVR